jgi:hypothetical protein
LSEFFRVAVNWLSLLPNERAAELVVPLATAFAGTIDAVAPRSGAAQSRAGVTDSSRGRAPAASRRRAVFCHEGLLYRLQRPT